MVVLDIFYVHPYLGKMNPFWFIFFRWVGSTTNQQSIPKRFAGLGRVYGYSEVKSRTKRPAKWKTQQRCDDLCKKSMKSTLVWGVILQETNVGHRWGSWNVGTKWNDFFWQPMCCVQHGPLIFKIGMWRWEIFKSSLIDIPPFLAPLC